MRNCFKLFVLASTVVLVAGPAASVAQSYQKVRGTFADYIFAKFDLNHDGKITRDEIAKVDAAAFAAATHGAGSMTQKQFATMRAPKLQFRLSGMFHRLDWNGDGKLSFEEYAAPQRVRFETLDRDGLGSESCAPDPIQHAAFQPKSVRHDGSGHERFCAQTDLNRDGMVTRAELDAATAKQFAAATSSGKFMNEQQFDAEMVKRDEAGSADIFRRIDTDHDGKLSLAEFSASDQKLFARLDRNNAGAITRDQLSNGFNYRKSYKPRS